MVQKGGIACRWKVSRQGEAGGRLGQKQSRSDTHIFCFQCSWEQASDITVAVSSNGHQPSCLPLPSTFSRDVMSYETRSSSLGRTTSFMSDVHLHLWAHPSHFGIQPPTLPDAQGVGSVAPLFGHHCNPMDCSPPGSSSRQEYWSRLSFHSMGDLPNPGAEPGSPALQAGSLPSGPPGSPQEVKDSNHKYRISFEVNLTHKLSVISGNWTSLELVKAFPVLLSKAWDSVQKSLTLLSEVRSKHKYHWERYHMDCTLVSSREIIISGTLITQCEEESSWGSSYRFLCPSPRFLPLIWKWKSLNHVQLFANPWPVACQALLSMDSPGQNTGVGSCSHLQEILPTKGLNPDLLHCRWIFTIWPTREAPLFFSSY